MRKVSRNKDDSTLQSDVMQSKVGNGVPPCILRHCYIRWPEKVSRHRDSLRAGWSGDRIHVMVKFSVPCRPAPRPTQLLVKWLPDLSWGAKRPQRGADHPLPTSAGLQTGWSYTSASPLRWHSHVMEWALPVCTHTLANSSRSCVQVACPAK